MKKLLAPLLVLLGLIVNTLFFQSSIAGAIFLTLYIFTTGLIWSQIFSHTFEVEPKYIAHILGLGSSFIFLGFLSSVFVVWYHVTSLIFSLIFIIFGIGSFLLKEKLVRVEKPIVSKEREVLFGFIPKSKFLFFCFGVLGVLQILILALIRTGEVLETPWQHIHPWYLYNFFLLTLLCILLLCSRISLRLKFLFVIVFSVLLHLYLPLTHIHPWGGDVWRMIGVESKLLEGQAQLPVLFGEGVQWRDFGFVPVPEALLIPHKYTYGHVWGLVTLLSTALHIGPVVIHTWFMAIFWSVFLPSIAFALGKLLFHKNEKAVALAFLTSFPFAFQAIGSITVGVSLGFVTFVLALFLWLVYLERGDIWQKRIALALGLGMLFGYALFALTFWLVVGVSIFMQKNLRAGLSSWRDFSLQKKLCLVGGIVVTVIFIPVVDFILGFSRFPDNYSFFASMKKMLAHLGGWSFARPISSEEIASGNIIFNHIPERTYVESIFTEWRFLVIGLMAFLAVAVVRAFWIVIRTEKRLVWQVLTFVFLLVGGGYIVGWYFLVGDRVFVRRLDSLLAFCILLFSLYGIFSLDFKKYIFGVAMRKRVATFSLCIFVGSFIATTLYASGPDIRVISTDEYASAEFLWQRTKNTSPYCVLSDTWLLLALEGASQGNIVGGGFPISAQFGQSERVALYNEFLKNPDSRIFSLLQKVIQTDICYVAVTRESVDPRTEDRIHAFLGNPIFKSGSVLVYKMDLKK